MPPLPDLPWTADQWAKRHVSNLLNTEDFARWATLWGVHGRAQEPELLAQLFQRARGKKTDAVEPSIPDLYRAAGALVASSGGQVGVPALSFHLFHAFIRHCWQIMPQLVQDKKRLWELTAYMHKASATSQRSALVAVSQQLGCACGGLGVWRPGMLKGRAGAAKKTRAATQPARPLAT